MKLTVLPIVMLPLALLTLLVAGVLILFSWRTVSQATVDAIASSVSEVITKEAHAHFTREHFLKLNQDPQPFEAFAAHVSSPRLLDIAIWTPVGAHIFPSEAGKRGLLAPDNFMRAQSGEPVASRFSGDSVVVYIPVNFLQRTASPDGIIELRYAAEILSEEAKRKLYFLSFFIVWILAFFLFVAALLLRLWVIVPVERLRDDMRAYMKSR